jgi:pimeloyl-ACP methyl ester carboxylesterase
MTETLVNINGQDGNAIWGKLCSEENCRLVVHIHGLTHRMNHLLEVTSSEFFNAKGYDHYRVGLYDTMEGSRKLDNSTLSTHTKDIQSILDHFRAAYDEIFVTAHSLGGLATLILNPQGVKAMSLWDPSFDVTNFLKSASYLTPVPERRQYHLDYGNIFVISEAMVDEMELYPDQQCLKLAKQVETPTQLVVSELGIFNASPHSSPENYRSAFAGEFDLHRVKGANHTFSNRGNREELFAVSLRWFNKHSQCAP